MNVASSNPIKPFLFVSRVTKGAAPSSIVSQESDGKDTYESASAYIRRKNRERRQRNRTIGTAEEALRFSFLLFLTSTDSKLFTQFLIEWNYY